MTERAALLAAIRAHPDEDTPRLVYADWLDEHGEGERAELIRVQCELARLHTCECAPSLFVQPGCTVCGDVKALYRRRYHLLVNLCDQFRPSVPHSWAVDLDGDLPDDHFAPGSSVSRGFTELVRCSAVDWLAHGDAILAEHPVREVRLTTLPQLTWYQVAHFRTAELPDERGSKMYDEKELADLPLNLISPIVAKEVLEKTWAGTAFDVPAFGSGGMLSQVMAATAS